MMSKQDQIETRLIEIEKRIDRIIKHIVIKSKYIPKHISSSGLRLKLKYGIKEPEYGGFYFDDKNQNINLDKRQEYDKKVQEYFLKVAECEKEFEEV